jgi:hypothetical protein
MTDKPFVDPNTDNLDDFSALMFGSAKPAESVQEDTVEEPEVEEIDVTETEQDSTPETDTEEDALEPEAEVEDSAVPAKPKKKTAQDRIKELTAKNYEFERAAEAERVRNAELAAKLAELEARIPKAAPTSTPTEDNGPNPTALDENGEMIYPLGEFDPKFIRDLTKYTIAQEQKASQAEAERARQAQVQQEFNQQLEQNWQSKVVEFEKTAPDFREKGNVLIGTFSNLEPNYGQFLAQTIMGMDHGPEVLNYLADNVTVAQEIVSKGPVGATIALGRLEARFTQSEKLKPRVSSAPAKTPPTSRGVAVGGEVRGDTDDLDAFSDAFFTKGRRRRN